MHLSQTYKSICIALTISLLYPITTTAQNTQKATAEQTAADTIPLFRGLSVSYDLAGTIMRMVGDYGQIEGALRVNLKDKYFPIVEIGLGSAKHETDAVTNIEAKTNAPYARIGCDINISKNKHDDYRVMFGARYGFTNFKQEIYGDIDVPYWGGTVPYTTSEKSISYHWAELVFSVDARLWGPVHLGWSFRYKSKLSGKGNEGEKIWYVPGYGKDGDKLGGTFNIAIELSRKNKKGK